MLNLDTLVYLKHKDYIGVEKEVLDIESTETVDFGLIDLSG